MYPDLNDEPQKSSTYQATTTTTTTKPRKNPDENKDNCCISFARFWITIVGILNLILGVFVSASALYAKFAYANYEDLSDTLPVGGIWMILGFGVVLAVCSVVLLFSTCCFVNGFFKLVLVIFAFILAVLLIMEIVSAGIFVWGLGVIALPQSSVADAAGEKLLKARSTAINGTWAECCIVNTPPYDIANVSKVDSVCLWPNSASVVKEACGNQDVLVCVCKDSTAYGSYFGMFLQSKLLWVSIVTITFAILLLGGLISTCVLIFATKKQEEKKEKYYEDDN